MSMDNQDRLHAFQNASMLACDQEEDALFMSREELAQRAKTPAFRSIYEWFLGSPGEPSAQVGMRLQATAVLMLTSCSTHAGWANRRLLEGVPRLVRLAHWVGSSATPQDHDPQNLTRAHYVALDLGSRLGGVLHCDICLNRLRRMMSPRPLVPTFD